MIANHFILAAIFAASTALQAAVAEITHSAPMPEFINSEELAKWHEAKTKIFKSKEAAAITQFERFYTGKPYLEHSGTYAFRFWNYDFELSRWTHPDSPAFV